MSETVKTVFFYGLFMDTEALNEQGFQSSNPRLAEVRDHKLQIGKRASMVAKTGESVWGVVATMAQTDLESLYSEQSVAEYAPKPFVAWLMDGTHVSTCSYVLSGIDDGSPNLEYASRLAQLAARLRIPQHYVTEVEKIATAKNTDNLANK